MPALTIQNGNSEKISSVKEWFEYAPPKDKERHWKDDRSAKELAKAWFRTGEARVPEELQALFKSHPLTKDLVIEAAIPEKQIKLDNFRGEPRNSDLILVGNAGDRKVVVGIEAKADESLGPIVHQYLEEKKGTKSKVPDRIELLLQSIFGKAVDSDLGRLRYQLVHGLAGTLIEAKERQASLALFVIHEFQSARTREENIQRNIIDLERFVHSFDGFEKTVISPGILFGPIRVPGNEFVPAHIPFLIGKVTTDLTGKP